MVEATELSVYRDNLGALVDHLIDLRVTVMIQKDRTDFGTDIVKIKATKMQAGSAVTVWRMFTVTELVALRVSMEVLALAIHDELTRKDKKS